MIIFVLGLEVMFEWFININGFGEFVLMLILEFWFWYYFCKRKEILIKMINLKESI